MQSSFHIYIFLKVSLLLEKTLLAEILLSFKYIVNQKPPPNFGTRNGMARQMQ